MHELALFAGAGGGLLGSRLLGWHTTCAVELDPRCRAILLARQQDGCLERFPIWDDIRHFDGKPLRGRIDIVTGGFPCQFVSTAARGRNNAEDLWPEMLRVVGDVTPARVLAENVQRKPIERAARDLAGLGYHCVVFRAPASAVGAPHRRVRWWVAADANGEEQHRFTEHAQVAGLRARPRPLWQAPPDRVDDGLARRLDVYPRGIGNGQVPQLVDAIGRALGWEVHHAA